MAFELFSDLKNALVELVSFLSKLNDQQRKEIKEILLTLKRDLTDSLVIAEQYLNGVPRSTRDSDLLDLLENAPSKLLSTYNELKICAALYHLRDRFGQWFSSVRVALNTTNILEIQRLINRIADGERFVVNELESVLRSLPNLASEYRTASPTEQDKVKERIGKYIADSLKTLRDTEKRIKKEVDAVITLM